MVGDALESVLEPRDGHGPRHTESTWNRIDPKPWAAGR